jgi:hypothetical protein
MDVTLLRRSCILLVGLVFVLDRIPNSFAAEIPSNDEQGRTLLVGEVVDDETGEPIKEFLALPGVSRLKFFGYRWQWQPHQIHAFEDGQLEWPPNGKRGYSQEQALRIEAEGYLPFVTPTIKQPREAENSSRVEEQPPEAMPPLVVTPGEPASITVRLKRDPGMHGRVVDANRQPLADATVAIGMGNFRNLHIRDGELLLWPPPKQDEPLRNRWERPRFAKSDADGRFSLPSEIQRARVIAVHTYGIRAGSYEDFARNEVIELQAWGRIEGQAVWNGTPAVGVRVRLFASHHLDETITDEDGRFVFEKIPPGEVGIGRDSVPPGDWNGIPTNPKGRVDVPPGGVAKCVLGGRGRPVVGKVMGFDNWRNVKVSVHLDLSWPSPSFRTEDDPTLPAFHSYISSTYYHHYDKPQFGIESDGSFRLNDVPAERYAIVVSERNGETTVRQGEGRFLIKMMATGESDEPFDVGTIEISPDARVSSRKVEPRGRIGKE